MYVSLHLLFFSTIYKLQWTLQFFMDSYFILVEVRSVLICVEVVLVASH